MLRASKSVGSVSVALEGVNASAKKASASLDGVGASSNKAAAAGANFGKIAGAGALVVAGALYESVKAATQFQSQMTKLYTQANLNNGVFDPKQFKQLENQMLDLAGAVGFSPNSLATGLYHAVSAGFNMSQSLDIVANSAKLAKIGGSDLEITTQAVIGTMAAFASQGLTAAQAAGLLNETVGLGDLKMQGLAQAISTGVLPVFAEAGLGMKDFSAALATMTDNVTPPEVAATRLRQAISQLAAPTSTAIKSLTALGIGATELATDMRQPNGLEVAIGDLKTHYDALAAKDGPVVAFNDLMHAFGGARSGSYVAELVDEFDRLQSKYTQVNQEDPALKLQQAWAIAQGTVSVKTQQIEASLQSLAVRMGTGLLPQVAKFEQGLLDLGKGGPSTNQFDSYLRSLLPDLKEIGNGFADIARLAGDVTRDVAPAFAVLGGATLKTAADIIGLLARVIGDVATGADKLRVVIEPLVILMGTKYVAGMLSSVAANGLFTASSAASTAATRLFSAEMTRTGLVAQGVAGKLDAGAISAEGLGKTLGPLGLAIAAVAGTAELVGHVAESFTGLDASAKKAATQIAAPYDLKSQQGLQDAINATQKALDQSNQSLKAEHGGFVGTLDAFTQGLIGWTGVQDPAVVKTKAFAAELRNLKAQQDPATQSTQDASAAMSSLSSATGLTSQATQDLQQQASGLQKSLDSIGGLAAAGTEAISAQTATNKAATKQQTADNKEALKEQRNAIEDTYKTAKNAAEASKNDVTNSSKGSKSAIQDYINTLGEKKTADLQALATTQSTSAGSAQAVQDSSGKAILSLTSWIKQLQLNQTAMQAWEQDLQTVAQKSGDPNEALKLAELDPKTYATAIHTLAQQNGDAFTQSNSVIQQSIESTNLDNTNTFLDGLKVMAEKGAEGANWTAERIAHALGDGSKAGILYVQGILDGYQGVIGNAVNPVLTGLGQPPLPADVAHAAAFPYGNVAPNLSPITASPNPRVKANAEGGIENHVAQIAAGGSMRVWAEPETGGEAYIPLAASKRQRSLAIWQQTGEMLGLSGGSNKAFASGGILAPPPALTGYALANTTEDAMQAMYNAATAFLNSSTQASAASGPPAPGAPQGQVVDWIHQAEAIAKWPDTYTNGIYQLIMHESGGRSDAVNRTDSNAAKGTPSEGITQTIGPTFNAYKFPGHNDIFNPVDNILAGISYALKNYGPGMVTAGGRHDAKGNYIGYADGGIRVGTYDQGGALQPGWTAAYNGTGKPEHVMTEAQIDKIVTAIKSNSGIQQNFYGATPDVETQRDMRRALA